ncbi:MAG TPA: NUDIX domain-containing protein [Dermatophilaceae bacterium]|jgi:8-oxo-dGTP diphosphatase
MTKETPSHSVSVAGVVIDADGRVLVIQRRDNGQWEAPGGILELDETLEQGVQREVKEETGIQVTVNGLTGVYKNMNRGIVALVYRCSIAAGHPRTSSETTSVRWVDRDQIDILMSPAYAIRVHDAFNTTAASRAHDGVNIIDAS